MFIIRSGSGYVGRKASLQSHVQKGHRIIETKTIFYSPRSNFEVPNGNAGHGEVNEPRLHNLEVGCRSNRDGQVQGNPNSQMDCSTRLHNQRIRFQYKLINAERLIGTLAEAILQLADLNLAPSSQGQEGEEDENFHDGVGW